VFPSLSVTQESFKVMTFVMEHLIAFEEFLNNYFPDLDISKYDWKITHLIKNISLSQP